MRKGRDREKRKKKKYTDENSGHYIIASSRPPERRPLERHTLAPKDNASVSALKLGLRSKYSDKHQCLAALISLVSPNICHAS